LSVCVPWLSLSSFSDHMGCWGRIFIQYLEAVFSFTSLLMPYFQWVCSFGSLVILRSCRLLRPYFHYSSVEAVFSFPVSLRTYFLVCSLSSLSSFSDHVGCWEAIYSFTAVLRPFILS
jgi:hypothetical protein